MDESTQARCVRVLAESREILARSADAQITAAEIIAQTRVVIASSRRALAAATALSVVSSLPQPRDRGSDG